MPETETTCETCGVDHDPDISCEQSRIESGPPGATIAFEREPVIRTWIYELPDGREASVQIVDGGAPVLRFRKGAAETWQLPIFDRSAR